jgi:hypothetical protein
MFHVPKYCTLVQITPKGTPNPRVFHGTEPPAAVSTRGQICRCLEAHFHGSGNPIRDFSPGRPHPTSRVRTTLPRPSPPRLVVVLLPHDVLLDHAASPSDLLRCLAVRPTTPPRRRPRCSSAIPVPEPPTPFSRTPHLPFLSYSPLCSRVLSIDFVKLMISSPVLCYSAS